MRRAAGGHRHDNGSAAIHTLAADCVLYMPRATDLDEVVAFLAAGTNVVTTRDEFFNGGGGLDDEQRARVLEACATGLSSIFATGSSPGFITDALPFALLSLQRHVESIEIEEFANLSERDSPHLLFEIMGFAKPPESYDARRAQYLVRSFGPTLTGLAEAAGRPVDRWSATGEVAAAEQRSSPRAKFPPERSRRNARRSSVTRATTRS